VGEWISGHLVGGSGKSQHDLGRELDGWLSRALHERLGQLVVNSVIISFDRKNGQFNPQKDELRSWRGDGFNGSDA
jgi:hypothetical protein